MVPDQHAAVRRIRVRRVWFKRAAIAAGVLLLLCVILGLHYASVVSTARQFPQLRDENIRLKNDLEAVRLQVAHLASTVERVGRSSQRLRELAMISETQRGLPIGPTQAPRAGDNELDVPNPFVRGGAAASRAALERSLNRVSAEATRQEQSLAEFETYFQEQRSILASAPTIWPVRGWVTSDFGTRVDPYTSERVMHSGIDIAGDIGREVVAPADGLVVFAGNEGGYGKVLVLDHGYGMKTRYGHLSAFKVKLGARVHRGSQIAALGNSGRTTGPHLHYEVRINGLPQNPRKFLFDD